MQALFKNQEFDFEDILRNLEDQGYYWAEVYRQEQVTEDGLWNWLRANGTLPHPDGLWVIDVRGGGLSPEYDAKMEAYDRTVARKEQARSVYDDIMVVVDAAAASQAA